MKYQFVFILCLLIVSSCSYNRAKNNQCSNLRECLELNSKLTGNNYIYEEIESNIRIGTVGDVSWTKENADVIFGDILAAAGYARLPTPKTNAYTLINARDVRYLPLPTFKASKLTNDVLPEPNSADYISLIYESKNGFTRPSQIARNLRPFMGRYGRVIDEPNSGILIINDNAKNVHNLLNLIRRMDVPVSKAEIEESEKFYKIQMLKEKVRIEMMAKVKEMVEQVKNPPKEDGPPSTTTP